MVHKICKCSHLQPIVHGPAYLATLEGRDTNKNFSKLKARESPSGDGGRREGRKMQREHLTPAQEKLLCSFRAGVTTDIRNFDMVHFDVVNFFNAVVTLQPLIINNQYLVTYVEMGASVYVVNCVDILNCFTTTGTYSISKFYYVPHSSKIMSQLFFFNFLAKKTEFGRVYKPKQEFR